MIYNEIMKKVLLVILVLALMVPVFSSSAAGSFKDLNVTDFYGKKVTAEVFKDYEVTMINVFTTWCTWCIKEMADLEEFSKNMPKGSRSRG